MLHNFIVPPNPKNKNGINGNGLPNYSILHNHQYIYGGDKTSWVIFFKKLLKISFVLIILGWIFFRYFAYWDIQNKCYITIYPSWMQFNNRTIIQGIDYLKEKHPNYYQEFCARVDNIDPNPMLGCGGIGGGCFWGATDKTIYIGTYPKQVLMSAAIIAHETCHQKQFDEKRSINEEECYKISNEISGRNDMPK